MVYVPHHYMRLRLELWICIVNIGLDPELCDIILHVIYDITEIVTKTCLYLVVIKHFDVVSDDSSNPAPN